MRAIENEDIAIINCRIDIEQIVRVGCRVCRLVESAPVIIIRSEAGAGGLARGSTRVNTFPAIGPPAEGGPLSAITVIGVLPSPSRANDHLTRAGKAKGDGNVASGDTFSNHSSVGSPMRHGC